MHNGPSRERLLAEIGMLRLDIQTLNDKATAHAEARGYLNAARMNLDSAERQLQRGRGNALPAIQTTISVGLATVMVDAVDADLKMVRIKLGLHGPATTPEDR